MIKKLDSLGFYDSLTASFLNIFDFRGRSRRSDFWQLFILFFGALFLTFLFLMRIFPISMEKRNYTAKLLLLCVLPVSSHSFLLLFVGCMMLVIMVFGWLPLFFLWLFQFLCFIMCFLWMPML